MESLPLSRYYLSLVEPEGSFPCLTERHIPHYRENIKAVLTLASHNLYLGLENEIFSSAFSE